MAKFVLQGIVSDCCSAGEDTGVGIGGVPLGLWADNNLSLKNTTVRWWMADNEMSENERIETVANMQVGNVTSEFTGSYSELTGHLWTNEEFKIGGHDMLEIMCQNIGKWCFLEAETTDNK